MSQLSLEDICLSFCRDTALEILALRQQGGGFLPCLTAKILRIYSSRINWYINSKKNTKCLQLNGKVPIIPHLTSQRITV